MGSPNRNWQDRLKCHTFCRAILSLFPFASWWNQSPELRKKPSWYSSPGLCPLSTVLVPPPHITELCDISSPSPPDKWGINWPLEEIFPSFENNKWTLCWESPQEIASQNFNIADRIPGEKATGPQLEKTLRMCGFQREKFEQGTESPEQFCSWKATSPVVPTVGGERRWGVVGLLTWVLLEPEARSHFLSPLTLLIYLLLPFYTLQN